MSYLPRKDFLRLFRYTSGSCYPKDRSQTHLAISHLWDRLAVCRTNTLSTLWKHQLPVIPETSKRVFHPNIKNIYLYDSLRWYVLKQDVQCLTNQSLIYACPEESTEQEGKLGTEWGTAWRQRVPTCTALGQWTALLRVRSPWSLPAHEASSRAAGSLSSRLFFRPQKHFCCKSFPLRKAQGAFHICAESK